MAEQRPAPKRRRSRAADSSLDTSHVSSPTSTFEATSESSTSADILQRGYVTPGRLGSRYTDLKDEPRLHPRLLQACRHHGLERMSLPSAVTSSSPTSSLRELEASVSITERLIAEQYAQLPLTLPSDAFEVEVVARTEIIRTGNNPSLTLSIYRPALRPQGAMPCLIFAPGSASGGMHLPAAPDKSHRRYCVSLAAQGMMIVCVNYGSPSTTDSPPAKAISSYPAALTDVCAVIHYVYGNRDKLGVLSIAVHGEGGGGNLALAAAIKAKREGWMNEIDRIIAYSPTISNAFTWSEHRKLSELPSLVECQGYLLNVDYLAYTAHIYTPNVADVANPLAWPYHARAEDLEGLIPHLIIADELSPLRDESLGYLRKLFRAGVKASGCVMVGSPFGTAVRFRAAAPEMHMALVREVVGFTKMV